MADIAVVDIEVGEDTAVGVDTVVEGAAAWDTVAAGDTEVVEVGIAVVVDTAAGAGNTAEVDTVVEEGIVSVGDRVEEVVVMAHLVTDQQWAYSFSSFS
ncbi:MAG: hypothetical protein JSV09_08280 [Thermoplasmata archaeon]|nr:MAG: hypothetical protein JSV09_08280 [Thermoplasmata archaeon]